MRKISAILIMAIVSTMVFTSAAKSDYMMPRRVYKAKKNIVRILVNDRPAGTGFPVGGGIIATNFHVVQQISEVEGQTQVGYASDIKVQLFNGRVLTAQPYSSSKGIHLQKAIGNDVALLTIPGQFSHPFQLGYFSKVQEGDEVYLIGYPLSVKQPIITKGVLSTKFKIDGYLGQGGSRSVAWLDINMNKGTSGGPVLLISGNRALNDTVIGIANFNLNLFAQSAEKFAKVAAKFPGDVMLMDIDIKKFSMLIDEALTSQSHGIGGCIAIDHIYPSEQTLEKH